MKKLSQITESVWGDIRNKSLGREVRAEDGKKIHTCLGIDVVVKRFENNYDKLIKNIIEGPDYPVSIVPQKEINFSPEEMKNVRNWEAPYVFLIYDGLHGTSLVADFNTYDSIVEYDDEFEEMYPEEDYTAICRCIATKLKEIGDCFEHVPRNKVMVLDGTNADAQGYEGNEHLCLITENGVYNWEIEHQEEYDNPFGSTYLDDFKQSIIAEFPELEDEDFLTWAYSNYGGCYIALPMNVNNVMNIRKYIEFTKKWFEA